MAYFPLFPKKYQISPHYPLKITQCTSPQSIALPPLACQCPPWANFAYSPRRMLHGFKTHSELYASNQAQLPHLPVPKLEATLKKWLQTIKPCVTPSQYTQALTLTHQFIKPLQPHQLSIGQQLQDLLEKRRLAFPHSSWLADYWLSWAYLSGRDSLAINSSFTFLFEDFPRPITQLERASLLAHAMLDIKAQIDNSTYPLNVIKNVPQCMSSYANFFRTTRIPHLGEDQVVFSPSRHQSCTIIVACKKQFFELNLVQDVSIGQPLSPRDILQVLVQLEAIVCTLPTTGRSSQPPIGILMTQNRDKWAQVRKLMLEDESGTNQSSLTKVEHAAFCLCLDDAKPLVDQTACELLLHGKGSEYASNRLYDKTINLIVFANGKAGLLGEHSMVDGYPVADIIDRILAWERQSAQSHPANTKVLDQTMSPKMASPSTVTLPRPTLLEWRMKTKPLSDALNEAIQAHNHNAANLDLQVLHYTNYGQQLIKKNGFSPDAFIQLSFQLAYYRLYQEFVPAYESCSTRKFLHGRTEVGRSLSTQVVEWIQALENHALLIGSSSSSPTCNSAGLSNCVDLFRIACNAHVQYVKEGCEGLGCDRHILGLKFLAQEHHKEHPFFDHPAHALSSRWILSTSQLPSLHSITGFGPVLPNGYGLFYNIRRDKLQFHITSFRSNGSTDSTKFSQSLEKALCDMQTWYLSSSETNFTQTNSKL